IHSCEDKSFSGFILYPIDADHSMLIEINPALSEENYLQIKSYLCIQSFTPSRTESGLYCFVDMSTELKHIYLHNPRSKELIEQLDNGKKDNHISGLSGAAISF